jgi:predicted permease
MLSTLTIVLPIFAVIFAGWLARRVGVLGPQAGREINRYVVYLALPALLFDIVAVADWKAIWHPGFVAAFTLGVAIIFLLTLFVRMRAGRPLADAAIDGLNASYGNTAYIGFPLTLAAVGAQGMPLTLIASIITVCALFAIAIVLIEIGVQAQAHPLHIARKVALSVLRNPLVLAPLLGALIPILGLTLPMPVETFLKMLGGTAAPCALVSLGLFLAADKVAGASSAGIIGMLVMLKLIVQPLVTWALVTYVFVLPRDLAHMAVLLAALPTGTGPFMLAELYEREARITGQVVLFTTVIGIVTLSAYLSLAQ